MSLSKTSRLLAPLILAAIAAGCASPEKNAIFVTKTSLAIVDVDSAPAGISIAYDRTEDYLGPRFANGSVAPVAGSFQSDGRIINRRVRQLYATGDAAVTVSRGATRNGTTAPARSSHDPAKAPPVEPPNKPASSEHAAPSKADGPPPRPMYFGTGTTIGLKIGFSSSAPLVPTSFVLGYRRKEASVIPVDENIFPAVIGALNHDVDAQPEGDKRPAPEFAITQFFATGEAARELALRDEVLEAFNQRRQQSLDPLATYRNEEARQGREVLDTVVCLDRLGADPKIARVFQHAEDSGVFASAVRDGGTALPATFSAIQAAPDAAAKRRVYLNAITLLNASSPVHTQRLTAHREAVCRIAGVG